MFFGRIFDIAGSIIVLAIIATFLNSPNTQGDVSAIGNTFVNSIKAAKA